MGSAGKGKAVSPSPVTEADLVLPAPVGGGAMLGPPVLDEISGMWGVPSLFGLFWHLIRGSCQAHQRANWIFAICIGMLAFSGPTSFLFSSSKADLFLPCVFQQS